MITLCILEHIIFRSQKKKKTVRSHHRSYQILYAIRTRNSEETKFHRAIISYNYFQQTNRLFSLTIPSCIYIYTLLRYSTIYFLHSANNLFRANAVEKTREGTTDFKLHELRAERYYVEIGKRERRSEKWKV